MIRGTDSDGTSSLPGSLFGGMPDPTAPADSAAAGEDSDLGPGARSMNPLLSGSDIEANDAASYGDFYASLGSGTGPAPTTSAPREPAAARGGEGDGTSITASLLGDRSVSNSNNGVADAGTSWFRLHRSRVNTVMIAGLALLFLVALWWMAGIGRTVQPPHWVPPPAYQVSFTITLANGLEEPGVAMVDSKAGAMRVSYYSGLVTHVLNATGDSFSLLPREDHLVCRVTHGGTPLQHVFPDTKRFKFAGEVLLQLPKLRGAPAERVACDAWEYKVPRGDVEGYYVGEYTLYTIAGSGGVPVRFSFVGHNVILDASHYDKYVIDYFDFAELRHVDPFWLRPPYGMPCVDGGKPDAGPKLLLASAQRGGAEHETPQEHAHGLSLLFPESETSRRDAHEAFRSSVRLTASEKGFRNPSLPTSVRRDLFHATLRMIAAHNRRPNKSYTLALNPMADWTHEERRRFSSAGVKRERRRRQQRGLRLGEEDPAKASPCTVETLQEVLEEIKASSDPTPRSVDHVATGVVLPPGEQGTCGSCWAFAATGALESRTAKVKNRPPVELSEQNLMDCSWSSPYGNHACMGGNDYEAYAWILEHNRGYLATAASYPYLNQPGFCRYDLSKNLVRMGAHHDPDDPPLVGCAHVTEQYKSEQAVGTTEELMQVFNRRLHDSPVSVAIDASPHDFYFYFRGVYDAPLCKSDPDSLDHAVLAVAYSLDAPVPYTTIRNNWGTWWGEQGYARIAQKGNVCGVATAAVRVEVAFPTASPTTPAPTTRPTEPPTNPPSPETPPPTTPPPTTEAPETTAPTSEPQTAAPTPQPETPPPTEPETPPPTEPETPPPTEPETPPPTEPETAAPTHPVTVSPTARESETSTPTAFPTRLPTTPYPSRLPTAFPGTAFPTTEPTGAEPEDG